MNDLWPPGRRSKKGNHWRCRDASHSLRSTKNLLCWITLPRLLPRWSVRFLGLPAETGLTAFVESFGRRRRTKVPEERTCGPRTRLWGFEQFGLGGGAM